MIKVRVLIKMKQKNKEILDEVNDEIEFSLKDAKGIIAHQRRLAFVLSLGTLTLIENYLDELKVFKSGGTIKHEWLKKKKDNAKKFISNQITCPIEQVKDIDELLDMAYNLEEERNKQAYGKNISEEILKEKLNKFLEFKKKLLKLQNA